MEYYSEIKRNQAPKHAITWVNQNTLFREKEARHRRPHTV